MMVIYVATITFTITGEMTIGLYYDLLGVVGKPALLTDRERGFADETRHPGKYHAQISGNLKPNVEVTITAEGCIGIAIFNICIGLEITVLDIGLPIAVAYNFASKLTCLGIYLTISGSRDMHSMLAHIQSDDLFVSAPAALAGRFYAAVVIDLVIEEIRKEITLFSWGAIGTKVKLYASSCCHDKCKPNCQGGIHDPTPGLECLL